MTEYTEGLLVLLLLGLALMADCDYRVVTNFN